MKTGEIYLFKPYVYEQNPERHCFPRIGLFLGLIKDYSGWRPSKFRILGPEGIEELWSNRWAVDPIPEFVDD